MSDADNKRRENTMRTVRTKVYKFNELTVEAQNKAIQSFSDINVNYDWWEDIYDDAKEIGLEINEFDLYQGTIHGKLINSLTDSCELVIANHGEECETHKTAKAYLAEWAKLVKEHSDGIETNKVCKDKESEFDELADELEKQYKLSLLQDYRIMLQQEYDYRTGKKAITESIISNQHEFTKDGKQFYQ
jgi:hypothetical protein